MLNFACLNELDFVIFLCRQLIPRHQPAPMDCDNRLEQIKFQEKCLKQTVHILLQRLKQRAQAQSLFRLRANAIENELCKKVSFLSLVY